MTGYMHQQQKQRSPRLKRGTARMSSDRRLLSPTLRELAVALVFFLGILELVHGFATTLATKTCKRHGSGIPAWMTATSRNRKTVVPSEEDLPERRKQSTGSKSNFLEDGEGHINRELAERIWNWEQELRVQSNRPKFPYSTRKGLRLVQSIVEELLDASSVSFSTKSRNAATLNIYEDLIQEGIIGLMEAMTQYNAETEDNAVQKEPEKLFEEFARAHITDQLVQSAVFAGEDTDFRDTIGSKRSSSSATSKPESQGSSQTEQKLQLKMQQNEQRRPKALSMESTVEIADSLLDESSYYSNQDEWEVRQGLVLDNGHEVKTDELVEEYLDETIQYEGEDQMYVQQHQVAAPLRDMIPDTERSDEATPVHRMTIVTTAAAEDSGESGGSMLSSVDDQALTDMIRYNVDEFLASTLDGIESTIIRLRFGLETNSQTAGNEQGTTTNANVPMTQKQVAETLGIPPSLVSDLQSSALVKLRQAYADRYLEQRSDDDDDIGWEDSV